MRLCWRGEKTAEGDVVCTVGDSRARAREFAVAGNANDEIRCRRVSTQLRNALKIVILAAQMNAIGTDRKRQRRIVVDNKTRAGFARKRSQQFCLRRSEVRVGILVAD